MSAKSMIFDEIFHFNKVIEWIMPMHYVNEW